ncbi:AAA family ATPase [uncultured Helicobacter sp.]|uniref:AAA family ATPase n=1 Tax=uncultured Helicobacter sp. TaxID=175537 RepID=UPI002638CB83|nr:AAA family ATPase [uncultured Helicobacter sp.]
MFIEKITICNLFAYYGKVEVVFKHIEGKNLYCIYGNNGFGKTSFINACKIAICGSGLNEFNRESGLYKKHKEVSSALAFIKGDKKGYSGVLNTNALNEMQENFYISLEGRINQKHFVIKRAFENVFDNVSERITLCLGDEKFADEEAQERINVMILPSNFVDFFFFNGEEIGEISKNLRSNLKEKIEEILRIKPLELMIRQIDNIKQELQKQAIDNDKQRAEFETKNRQLTDGKKTLESTRKRLKDLQSYIQDNQSRIAQLHKEKDKLIADSDEAQKKLYRERDTLDEKLQTHKSHLEENLKYVIFDSNPKILSQLKDELKHIQESRQSQDIDTYNRLLPELKSHSLNIIESKAQEENLQSSNINIDTLQEIIEKVLDTLPQSLAESASYSSYITPTLITTLSHSLIRFENDSLSSDITAIKELKNNLSDIKHEIDELYVDEYTQNRKLEKEQEIENLMQDTKHHEEMMRDTKAEENNLQETINHLQRDVESLKQHIHLERIEDKLQILEYLQETLRQYKTKLILCLKEELKDKILQKYQLLTQDNIAGVEIDEAFEITLKNERFENIYIGSQSSGQNQLLAIAIFWALSELSNAHIPLIIDTPLGRIDGANRARIIQNYYAQNLQTIILPTDTEISTREYEYAKPHIAGLYKIENQSDRSHAYIKVATKDEIL